MKTLYEIVATKDEKPTVGSNVLISYDGAKTFPESADYLDRRTCMLAGVGGGNGYFGEGFASDGSTGCDRGLILDEPTHWMKEIDSPTGETLYRKVSVKERLPKEQNTYFTGWDREGRTIIIGSNYFNGELFEDDENTERYAQPDFWLEEIPAPLSKGGDMPTDEEIGKEAHAIRVSGGHQNESLYREGFTDGAKWMREEILRRNSRPSTTNEPNNK